MKLNYRTLGVCFLATALAGCVSQPYGSGGYEGPRVYRPQPEFQPAKPPKQVRLGVDGTWRDGPIRASFNNGQFESRNVNTNDVVAAGAYQYNSDSDIRLQWAGALSGSGVQKAKCEFTGPDTLYCKPTNGSGFSLLRV